MKVTHYVDKDVIVVLARQFCEADVEYHKTIKELVRVRRGLPYQERDRFKVNEQRTALAPINKRRRDSLNKLKQLLCGWVPDYLREGS